MSQRYIGGVVTETTNVAQSPWTGEWTQQAALQGFAGAQAPLKVANSLRFRSSASAYLSRTPSVAGNQKTWTWSGWVKRGALGTSNFVLFSRYVDASNFAYLRFTSSGSDELRWYEAASGVVVSQRDTTQVFRDPSSWYHIILAYDTTQANAADRVKIYVNGVQITAFATTVNRSQNADGLINAAAVHQISAVNAGTFFDGYLANINFVDGQALPPTAFGTINKENGVWSPITYTGTYGTNGFKLNFSNGTSTTTLGYDSSGNGNNWTTNNISLTAGSTYDWMIDSPTKYPGSSYGVGNYCVLNPLNKYPTSTTASANLQWSPGTNSVWNGISGSIAVSSGKWYWEYTLDQSGVLDRMIGIFSLTDNLSSATFPGNSASSYGFYSVNGQKYNNATATAYGSTYQTAGDVIGIALDLDTGTLTFYKNGTSQGVAFSGIAGTFTPGFAHTSTAVIAIANFGQRPFAYTPPSGYKSLCTQNLPGVTIQNGAGYMAATLWAGNNASQSIVNTVNGVSFQPDFAWIKVRTVANDHVLVDVNRGVNKTLASNTTAAEITESLVTSFNSDGLTLAGNYQRTNQAGNTYIGWQWKAGGTAVTNTAGSITSSVSANTTSGFSVVTYTGNGTNPGATIGHGLGATPSMIITKARNTAGTWWPTYHSALPISNTLYLNDTVASTTYVNRFSAVSSTTFTTGSNGSELNTNAVTYVAYCFAAIAGYSAFGSYTGNGSADGPFVYCGFRPRFVMVKCSSAVSDWTVVDTSRSPYNLSSATLFPNASAAEGAGFQLDILSNGFKLRATGVNTSSATYIYAAFAENPFQNALAR